MHKPISEREPVQIPKASRKSIATSRKWKGQRRENHCSPFGHFPKVQTVSPTVRAAWVEFRCCPTSGTLRRRWSFRLTECCILTTLAPVNFWNLVKMLLHHNRPWQTLVESNNSNGRDTAHDKYKNHNLLTKTDQSRHFKGKPSTIFTQSSFVVQQNITANQAVEHMMWVKARKSSN